MNPVQFYIFICGMVLLALSIWMFKRLFKVLLSDGRARGHIIGHEKRVGADSTHYYPVMTFVDHNGVQHRITIEAGWIVPRPPIGAEVNIRYLRQNPELAYIDSFYHLWFGPLAVAGFAAALFFFVWQLNTCLNHPDHPGCGWGSMSEL